MRSAFRTNNNTYNTDSLVKTSVFITAMVILSREFQTDYTYTRDELLSTFRIMKPWCGNLLTWL